MIDDQLVLRVERLRDAVDSLRIEIRSRYQAARRPVTSGELRDDATRLGERWLVEIAPRDDVRAALGDDIVADLSVEFQRLIRYAEAQTMRGRYDVTLRSILRDFRNRVVVPLKQSRGTALRREPLPAPTRLSEAKTAFIGQSFASNDEKVNRTVQRFLESIGITVQTGERPAADSVSAKVRSRIEAAQIFVGIFARRDRIAGRREWSTSNWIVDEKAYALAKEKRLVLIKEEGVQSIGGLQGDYDYLEFSRDHLEDLLIKLIEIFKER